MARGQCTRSQGSSSLATPGFRASRSGATCPRWAPVVFLSRLTAHNQCTEIADMSGARPQVGK